MVGRTAVGAFDADAAVPLRKALADPTRLRIVALSLPEMIVLRRVLKPQPIAIFVAIVGVGFLFDAVL